MWLCTEGTKKSPRMLAVGCLALLVPALAQAQPTESKAELNPARIKQLIHLVRQDCGACHGLTLQGGLGPALTAEALRDKPAESLVATILNGRGGTPMPPFRTMLADSEAEWIVRQLQAGFPPL